MAGTDENSAARDAFAVRVSEALYAKDQTSQRLGIRIDAIAMGAATLSMEVRDDMINGHAICHGGFIFTLADTAMAYASNGANVVNLAQHAQVTFIAPGKHGERMTAAAREVSRSGRNGLYDVDVRGEDGRMIAAFRGSVRAIKAVTDPALGEAP